MLYTCAYMETNNETQQLETSPQTTKLTEVLQTLDKHMEKQNSFKYAFLRGVIYGLGTVFGATVLVALLGGIIASAADTFGAERLINTIFGQ